SKYIKTTEQAKIIRTILKESFPKVKFSVRSDSYSGGSSIDVSWLDGPNKNQVDSVLSMLSGSYFDSMIDYKGLREHVMNGERVSFSADFIFCERSFSSELIDKSISAVYKKYMTLFKNQGHEKPMAKEFKNGSLFNVYLDNSGRSVQELVSKNVNKRSTFPFVCESKTRDKIAFVGDEGYGESAQGKVNHLRAVK
ncbi:unnamed protein product, partial [marine sediment metagenome]